MNWESSQLGKQIDVWINEDLGRGDLTKPAVINKNVKAHWIAKQDGIFCGSELIRRIFERIDNKIKFNLFVNDGVNFKKNQILMEIYGPTTSLLASERISLNIVMHLSGIATYTHEITKNLEGTGIKLADTRKTTPGLRILEKYAFKCGGGINHRIGLYDAAMIKENHIAWSNNLEDAVKKIRENSPFITHIIIEAESITQAKEAILAGADSILLDEIAPSLLSKHVNELRDLSLRTNQNSRKRLVIEVSGINPNEIKKYLIKGIDYISTSAATTKSNWIDLSMRYI